MMKIKIKRPEENFNTEQKYAILIDGKKVSELKNGEEKIIQLSKDAEILEAKVRSGSSEKLSVSEISENETLEISGEKWRNSYGKYAGALIPLIGLSIVLNHDYPILKIIGLIVLLLYVSMIIYILGFQKRKWLQLKKIS